MPAKNLQRIDDEGLFLHICNKGIENQKLFKDEEDIRVFVDYLREYLSTPRDTESTKKTFQVRGRTFRGTPHQPKNYFQSVELVAYNILPTHFHLALHQVTKGSVESFIRSLCTRYSIYFNKKYSHSGSLFAGPYKSTVIQIDNLPALTRFFHFGNNSYSSYSEYLSNHNSLWIKSGAVLDSFDSKNDYKIFMEKYSFEQLPENILLETESEHLEKNTPKVNDNTEPLISNKPDHHERRDPPSPEPTLQYVNLKNRSRMPEFLTISTIFFLILSTFSIRNIWITEYKSSLLLPTNTSAVLSVTKEEKPEVLPETEHETIITIKTEDSSMVNIRQNPSTNSKKISKAKNGDTFELIAKDSDWFEVKLASGSAGFISAEYAEEGK